MHKNDSIGIRGLCMGIVKNKPLVGIEPGTPTIEVQY